LHNQVKLADYPQFTRFYLSICFLFYVLISLASCLDETTNHVETVLIVTLLLENGLVHLPI